MQIVIDISEEAYNAIIAVKDIDEPYESTLDEVVYGAIAKGTPLPKGHGRLIDADALYENTNICHSDEDGSACVEWRDVNDAPTIIEADMSESEEE